MLNVTQPQGKKVVKWTARAPTLNVVLSEITEVNHKTSFWRQEAILIWKGLISLRWAGGKKKIIRVWPDFISVIARNIICVWVCRELQPLLDPLLMRDCHSRVSSLQADVVSKSASQRINQSFAPKASGKKRWVGVKPPQIDGLIRGMDALHSITNKQTNIHQQIPLSPSQEKLQFGEDAGFHCSSSTLRPDSMSLFQACGKRGGSESHCDAATPADTGRGRGAGRPRRALRYEVLVRPTNDGQPSQWHSTAEHAEQSDALIAAALNIAVQGFLSSSADRRQSWFLPLLKGAPTWDYLPSATVTGKKKKKKVIKLWN